MPRFKERKYAVVKLTRDKKYPRKKATVEILRLSSSTKDAKAKRKLYIQKHPTVNAKDVRVTRLPIINKI